MSNELFAVARMSLDEFDLLKCSRTASRILKVPPSEVASTVRLTGGFFARSVSEEVAQELVQALQSVGVRAERVSEAELALPEEYRTVEVTPCISTVTFRLQTGESVEEPWHRIDLATAFLLPGVVQFLQKSRQRRGIVFRKEPEEELHEKRMRAVVELLTADRCYRFEDVRYDPESNQAVPLDGERARNLAREVVRQEGLNFGRGIKELATGSDKVLQFSSRRAHTRYCEWLWLLTRRGVRVRGEC